MLQRAFSIRGYYLRVILPARCPFCRWRDTRISMMVAFYPFIGGRRLNGPLAQVTSLRLVRHRFG